MSLGAGPLRGRRALLSSDMTNSSLATTALVEC